MGFTGGGANVTKAHQHDSAVVQDGGALAANATQFGLTNGSLLYSDGTNIQELGVGLTNEVLGTASGTVPTWEAPATVSTVWKNIESQTNGDRVDIGSIGGSLFSDYKFIKFIYQWRASGNANVEFIFRDSAADVTDYDELYHREHIASSLLYLVNGATDSFQGYTEANNTIFGRMLFTVSPAGGMDHTEVLWKNVSSGNNDINYLNGVTWVNTSNDITGIYLTPQWTPAITTGSCSYEVMGIET